jgi:hypothetical protein
MSEATSGFFRMPVVLAHFAELVIGRFDLLAPDGQIADTPVQPFLQKYSCSLLTQITSASFAIPYPREGRVAIVTDVGNGMRWTR